MSIATSIPCIKLSNSSSTCSSSSSSSSPSSSCSLFRFHATKPSFLTLIRSSQTEGPIRRPVAPSSPTLREPSPPSIKPVPPSPPTATPPPTPTSSTAVTAPPKTAKEVEKSVVTLEFQRQVAKELQEYFKQKKLEEADQGPFFGFLGKNEIANGRWAMFGFAVGMLTEYATGSNFVDQVKILLSNFGIVDLE
ncbi:hypothetical protein RJ641_031756 [Dillenia turbinata]|uniref:Light-harvesting complex-like protein OHP2, chloroplastic n=1 Tax=Dillenia turbinata TaxID=194707 RepID=A0AAN8W1J3_9MAGN